MDTIKKSCAVRLHKVNMRLKPTYHVSVSVPKRDVQFFLSTSHLENPSKLNNEASQDRITELDRTQIQLPSYLALSRAFNLQW